MKKSYFWGLLFAIMALIPAQNAFALSYCDPTGTTSNYSGSYYGIGSCDISVNGEAALSFLVNADVCNFYDTKSFEIAPGDEIKMVVSGTGAIHSQWGGLYVYADWNQDGEFDNSATSTEKYTVYSNPGVIVEGVEYTFTVPADFAWVEGNKELGIRFVSGEDPVHGKVSQVTPCSRLAYGSTVTIKAIQAVPERTISVSATPAGAGSVLINGEAETTLTSAGQVTITAVPNSGYAFSKWIVNGVEGATTATFVDNTEGDKEYVAEFVEDPTLDRTAWEATASSYEYDGEGAAGGWPSHTIDGRTETFWHSDYSVTPNPTAPHWLQYNLGSVQKFTSFNYVSRNADSENISCNGNAKTYKLYVSNTDISADLGAGYVPNGLTAISEGEFVYDGSSAEHVVDLGAEYEGQYVFLLITDSWNSSASTKYGNCAEFYLYYEGTTPAPTPVYAVSVATADEAMGTAEVSATEVEEGEEVTFTATAAEGYQFVNWTSGEEVVSTENPYTVAVTAEMALTANFELIPVTKYTVTVNAGVGGTAEASATEVEEGQTVTLTATAAEGYTFANWTSSAVEPVYYIQNYTSKKYLGYNTVNLAAIDEQTSDATIAPSTLNDGEFTIYLTNATYDQQTPPQAQSYVHCGSNGRFSGNSVNTSASQQIAVFKVEDPAAETITATKVSEITSGATYMFVGLKSGVYYALTDELYEANHATDQRMVGAEVTITDGTITFTPGTSSALWTIVNKAVASTENPYTVTVTADVEYTANFVAVPVIKHTVSVTTVDGAMGTAEVSATEVEEGDEVTFTASANLGYKFTCWTVGTDTISTENPYTTAVTAEMSLVANFEALTPAIIVTNDTTGVERQFTFDAFVEGAKVQIDWGNGDLEEYDIAYYDSWTTWTTTITGTLKGEGIVKIYGDQIRSFDCSYSASYPVKVTSLDLTGCPNLYELVCNSNQLTSLDLSANTALVKLTANNSAFAEGIDLSANTALTTIDFNDAGLPSIDLSSNTALTSVKLNNNPLGSIDVSANTALTTLYANNTGLTTIDLSANTVLKNLYVNENQLTSLNISTLVAGSYTFANDNQLTELITAPEMLTSKTRINIKNNNFTLATLPVITGINAYNYAPQNAMTIATEITEGEELDLSSQAMVGENATVYAWYTTEGEEFTGYTVEGGKFVFNVEADTELYCTMTNASFANFSGANVFKTTNIVVKNFAPAIIVTNDTTGVERQFTFDAFVEGAKVQIDWGNGDLEEYDIAYYDSWTTWTTTITGTLKGEGIVKIYGDQIRSFDCSYSASYPVKVTSLDLTGCPNLYELVCNSNQLTSLDLSANTALVKLTANNSAFAEGIDLSANTALTTIDFNDAGLPSIDLSSNTALTSVKLNNNPLGSIDVSALTALTTLYANNTGLTTIDLSANTKLKNLYVNENQLTSLNISTLVAGSYTFANDNQLTELITAPEMLTSKTRINIKNNNFTLATLPVITGINAYNYAPQNAMAIAAEITEGEELDLSSQAMVGENATVYAWYTTEGEEFTGYTVEGGKFVFNVEADTELYCTMTNASFANFSGANVFKTTNIIVKYVAVERKVQFKSSNITMGTVQIISPSQGGTGTGGTGTGGTGTGGTGTGGTGTGGTGTGTGSATSGGGQSPWVITTEDVTAQASVQGNAYEFVNWTIGEEIVGTELTYTYTGEEEALIQANFRQKETYKTITIDVKPVVKDEFGTNLVGSVKFQGRSGKTAIIEQGSSLTAVATAKEGYEFSSWKDASTGEDVSFDAEYTFTVAADINLEAWFSELPVVTTCEVVVNIAPTEDYGTVVIEGAEGLHAVVEVGTEVTAVATPAEGKIFEGWFTFVGDELSTEATYTFTATEDVVIVAWFTDAPEAEYCTYEGKSTHSERRLNAVTITDGTNTTAVSSIQPYFRGDVYVDKTDVVFPSYAGATVNFSDFDFKGEWMHAYVYIDYNNDKVFDTTVNADGTTGGELVSFTFYSATDSGTGVNSLGETVSNYTIPMVNYLPAFTLPADLEDGDYRVRVKIDWSHLDPCGHPSESANKLTANGGCIADFTMSISDFNGVEFTEAAASQVYAADGVIYINGYEGNVKVVNVAGQVVKDVNVDGNDTLEVAAGLYMVVTGDQVTKVVVK